MTSPAAGAGRCGGPRTAARRRLARRPSLTPGPQLAAGRRRAARRWPTGRVWLGVGLGLAALGCGSDAVPADVDLAIVGGTVIDGTGSPPIAEASILVSDGRVVAIATGLDAPPEGARVVDARGRWIIPGLIDTHTHVARFPEGRPAAERILETALAGGVTGIRDMGGDARPLAAIEAEGTAAGRSRPTVRYAAALAGPALFPGSPLAQFSSGYEPGAAPWARALAAVEEVATAVAGGAETGAAGIKVYADLNEETATAIIREARARGLAAWAHATVFPTGPGALVEAGAASLSHAPYLVWEAVDDIPDHYAARTAGPWTSIPPSHPRILALFDRMAARGVSLDATLFVFREMGNFSDQVDAGWTREALPWAVEATRLAHARGVRVTTGTDWFEPRDPDDLPHTHEELAILVEAVGLSPLEAIVAATRNGAEAMGVLGERGTLEVGRAADLIVLDDDPLADIRNTRSIAVVVKDGVVIER